VRRNFLDTVRRYVGHVHPGLSRRLDVDVVDADAVSRDDSTLRYCLDGSSVQVGAEIEYRIGVGELVLFGRHVTGFGGEDSNVRDIA